VSDRVLRLPTYFPEVDPLLDAYCLHLPPDGGGPVVTDHGLLAELRRGLGASDVRLIVAPGHAAAAGSAAGAEAGGDTLTTA
jgi:hypothetical protein